MKQQTFSDIEYSNRRKRTKRDEFLEIMNEIIPNNPPNANPIGQGGNTIGLASSIGNQIEMYIKALINVENRYKVIKNLFPNRNSINLIIP